MIWTYLNYIKLSLDSWTVATLIVEESPGSIRTRCQLTAGEGDLRDSATENKPPNQGKGEKVW